MPMVLLRHLSRRPLTFLTVCRHVSTSTKPYYINTPIFYPNASPHIGHLYTLVTADVFARYQRLKRGSGADIRFLAGTDEHGMKIQKAARAHFGVGGREKAFCDTLSERFRVRDSFSWTKPLLIVAKDLGKRASISNTCFMRTTSNDHRKAVEDVWVSMPLPTERREY